MIWFSYSRVPMDINKSKKLVQQSTGPMDSNLQENSQDRAIKASFCSGDNLSDTHTEQDTSLPSNEGCWKLDVHTGDSCPDENKELPRMMRRKKSQSLGSVLDKRRDFSGDDVTEDDEVDQESSYDYFHEGNTKIGGCSFDSSEPAEVDDYGGTRENTSEQHHKNEASESFELIADPEHHGSIFSVEVLKQFDGEQHDDVVHSTGHITDSIHSSSNTPPSSAKSCSASNLRVDADSSNEGGLTHELTGIQSRSFEHLCSLHGGSDKLFNGDNTLSSEAAFQRHIAASYSDDTTEPPGIDAKGFLCHAVPKEEYALSYISDGFNEVANQETAGKYFDEKIKSENQSVDRYNPHNDDKSNEWRVPETDGIETKKNLQQDTSIQNWDQLTSEEFNIKRIEDWISQIDIQNSSVVEELGESSSSVPKNVPQVMAAVTTTMNGANNLGTEVAYNYITSLPSSSSSAHMSNLGLVAVPPYLGAFCSLRVLNLSGNTIVRITAGALPRGLHMLNLSKNNISTIEGLRGLTCLRVLDLSFNRIIRIGHGLASCSSLKELYLAGNMIGEVEGLHRLLKLNILDIRFNKISTAKGLGQLAANYDSLEAINLEGNPAQINVGGEQLKKYLLSFLPKLVFYNKITIRSGSSKDAIHRPPLSLRSHHSDRGNFRRGSLGSGLHRSTSSNNIRSSPAMSSSSKQSKNHRVRLPPAGSKATTHQPHFGAKLLGFRPDIPIHRSPSEGTM